MGNIFDLDPNVDFDLEVGLDMIVNVISTLSHFSVCVLGLVLVLALALAVAFALALIVILALVNLASTLIYFIGYLTLSSIIYHYPSRSF